MRPGSGSVDGLFKRQKHVVVLTASDYRGYPFGGTESLVGDLLSGWGDHKDYRITLVGLGRDPEMVRRWDVRRFGRSEYPYVAICAVRNPGRESVRFKFVRAMVKHGMFLRDLVPDLIYAHSAESARAAALIWRRVPIVLHCHGVYNPIRLSRFRIARGFGIPILYERMIYRPALRRAALVLVNGDQEQFREFTTTYRRALNGHAERVPATVDLTIFHPLDRARCREQSGISPGATVAVFVGRLEAPKGVDLVLHTIHTLREGGLPAQLLIVGDGGYRAALEALAVQLNLAGHVRFLGARSREAVPQYLCAADVFVSGTVREAISMALLEALACGIPAVVSNADGARELIVDGWNGYLVPERDAGCMARQVADVAKRSAEMRDRCIETAKRYDAAEIGVKILDGFSRAS